jgi:5'-nucleotidase
VSTSRRLRALITNDDGIDSPGLWALAAAARDAGFDVVVAAPHVDASGVGASVVSVPFTPADTAAPIPGARLVADDSARAGNRTRVHAREIDGLDGIPAYAVEGHPAWIVHAACRGWFDPVPDVVLSGINVGANVGRMVLHSGTVGAALTASLHGCRALAVSLDTGWEPPERPHWEAAQHMLPGVLDLLLAGPEGTVLSLNVPDRPVAELGELREATLVPFGAVQVRMEEGDGALHATFADVTEQPEPGTDVALLAQGHPTITALASVAPLPGVVTMSPV